MTTSLGSFKGSILDCSKLFWETNYVGNCLPSSRPFFRKKREFGQNRYIGRGRGPSCILYINSKVLWNETEKIHTIKFNYQ